MRTTRFTVAMPRPETHLYDITMEVDPRGATRLDLVLPVWTPGSYLVREFSRHVRDFSAKERGRAARRSRSRRSRRTSGVSSPFKEILSVLSSPIHYRVYAHELTVRTSHLDSSHAYGNGANLFFYVEGRKDEPQEVAFRLPRGWKTSMALPERGGVFRAADYDELVDSPFECGTHRTFPFRGGRGSAHARALGRRQRGRGSTRRRPQEARQGGRGALRRPAVRALPLPRAPVAGRARRSRAPDFPVGGARPARVPARKVLSRRPAPLLARAVPRLERQAHPARGLRPVRLRGEVYTKDLWALEGITSYYETLLLVRAGLLTEAQAFEQWTTLWKGHLETPGRKVQSAEMASFDTWIRFYRPDENSPNVSESYYRRGALLGLALDLTLRRATGGRRGLDDVLRRLFRAYAAKGKGYPRGRLRGGVRARRGRAPPRARLLRPLRARHGDAGSRAAASGRGPPAARGARGRRGRDGRRASARRARRSAGRRRAEGGRLVVAEVLAGGPAERGGVNAGDVLVALDGLRATEELIAGLEKERKPGSRVAVTVFRRDVLETHRVRLGARRASVWKIEALADAPAGRPAPEGALAGPIELKGAQRLKKP